MSKKKEVGYIISSKNHGSYSCKNCDKAFYDHERFKINKRELLMCEELGSRVSINGVCNKFMSIPQSPIVLYGIKEAHILPDFKVHVKFNDGKEGTVDLRHKYIQEEKTYPGRAFYNEEVFNKMALVEGEFLEFEKALVEIYWFELRHILGFEGFEDISGYW